jgi:membrane protein DedA with SNARE-associated domain
MHFWGLDTVFALILQYHYLFIFPIVVIEGPIITVILGYLVSLNFLNPAAAYFVAIMGDLAGDILYYYAGRWGRSQFLEKYGHYIGLKTDRVLEMEKIFEKHSTKSLFWGKFTLGIGGMIIFAAGASRVSFRKFFGYSIMGTIPKSFLLMLVGFYFGHAYQRISKYFDYTALTMIAVTILLIATYLIIQHFAEKQIKK